MSSLSNDTKPVQEGLRPTRAQCLRDAAKVYADHLARVAALGGRETAAA